jgi:hypothetical protein
MAQNLTFPSLMFPLLRSDSNNRYNFFSLIKSSGGICDGCSVRLSSNGLSISQNTYPDLACGSVVLLRLIISTLLLSQNHNQASRRAMSGLLAWTQILQITSSPQPEHNSRARMSMSVLLAFFNMVYLYLKNRILRAMWLCGSAQILSSPRYFCPKIKMRPVCRHVCSARLDSNTARILLLLNQNTNQSFYPVSVLLAFLKMIYIYLKIQAPQATWLCASAQFLSFPKLFWLNKMRRRKQYVCSARLGLLERRLLCKWL